MCGMMKDEDSMDVEGPGHTSYAECHQDGMGISIDQLRNIGLSSSFNAAEDATMRGVAKRIFEENGIQLDPIQYVAAWVKLESSSTKIVQCPGPVKFSSFQPPERVFCVFRETGFQFSSCDRFSFLRKSSAVTYSFVHLGWIAFLLVLLCERKREKACFAPFLCSCVLSCRFFSI